MRILFLLVFIGFFADFIANERPLYCKIDNKTYYPVLKQYAVDLKLSNWDAKFTRKSWSDQEFQSVVYPLIPYSHYTQDIKNRGFISPIGQQNIEHKRFRHWLGTDHLGRDIAAGMVHGTRIALLVGLISMFIASILGIFFGALAGYFGDHGIQLSRLQIILLLLGLPFILFYSFIARRINFAYAETTLAFALQIAFSILIFVLLIFLLNRFASRLSRLHPYLRKQINIPLDIMIMRLIEIMNSIPALLVLLAFVAVIKKPSIFYVMLIIGLIRWTSIARFLRAELLRIRNLEYIQSAKIMGYSHWRIIWRHALPNALSPIYITIAFGIAGAILLEAFMSFLGIGVAANEVTWGSMLSIARQNFSAWWLALFPGLAIFISVTIFNLIGEGLNESLESDDQ